MYFWLNSYKLIISNLEYLLFCLSIKVFISENENVATIKDGVIKANDIGNTLILIKNKDIIKEINVEVR